MLKFANYLPAVCAFTALCMAACSQDDALQTTVNDNDGLKAVTVAATLPEASMTTRAAGGTDATATRCYVQVLDSEGSTLGDNFSDVKEMTETTNGFTTTVYLNAGDTYTFLFWADSDNGTAPTDLTAVEYNNNGETIAWAGKETAEWSADGVTAELKHVVARVTVHTTTAVTLKEGNEFTCLVPTTYKEYNVLTEEVSEEVADFTYTDTGSSATADGDLCHFYVLVGDNEDNRTLTLRYNGELGNPAVRVDNVPLKPNCHTTLTGDVYNLGLTNSTITATLTTTWDDEVEQEIEPGYTVDGNGTYIVTNAKGLQAWAAAVAIDRSTNCTLAADIDMTGQEWTPVNPTSGYSGTFDGAGHTISGLTVSTDISGYAGGLINYFTGTVKDLKLTNAMITSTGGTGTYAGGIVGGNSGTLSGCSFSGTVSGSSYTGGIAGISSGTLSDCSFTGTVSGTGYVGGIVAENRSTITVSGCRFEGTVSGTGSSPQAGGIVGHNRNGIIAGCSSSGKVTAISNCAGGIVGYANSGSVIACYSTADIEVNFCAGGIAGQLYNNATVLACYYSTGTVSASTNYGSIAGNASGGTITTCYSDVTAAGSNGSSGTYTSDWADAAEAMNEALEEEGYTDYMYEVNTGSDAATVPLKLVSQ